MQMKSEKPTFYILSTLCIAVSSFTLQKLYSILSSSLKEERNVYSGWENCWTWMIVVLFSIVNCLITLHHNY